MTRESARSAVPLAVANMVELPASGFWDADCQVERRRDDPRV